MIDTDVAPVVRWIPGRGLVDHAGLQVTNAQDAKSRRYVEGGHIQRTAEGGEVVGWGQPSKTWEVYELQPIPGCRQLRRVKVTSYRDAVGDLVAVDYACDCQRSRGTKSVTPGVCSHSLAVSRYRREA